MRRTRMPLVAAVVAAVLSAVTSQGTATATATATGTATATATGTAAGTAAGADAWDPRYPCAGGAFDLGSLTSQPAEPPEDPAVTSVTLNGSLTCEVPATGAKYALVVYPSGMPFGVVNTTVAVLPYETTKDPQPFRVTGGVTAQQDIAICVAADTDLRIACVELSVKLSGAGGYVSAREVATSDPLVDRPLLISSRDIDPSCGTCWRLKKP